MHAATILSLMAVGASAGLLPRQAAPKTEAVGNIGAAGKSPNVTLVDELSQAGSQCADTCKTYLQLLDACNKNKDTCPLKDFCTTTHFASGINCINCFIEHGEMNTENMTPDDTYALPAFQWALCNVSSHNFSLSSVPDLLDLKAPNASSGSSATGGSATGSHTASASASATSSSGAGKVLAPIGAAAFLGAALSVLL